MSKGDSSRFTGENGGEKETKCRVRGFEGDISSLYASLPV